MYEIHVPYETWAVDRASVSVENVYLSIFNITITLFHSFYLFRTEFEFYRLYAMLFFYILFHSFSSTTVFEPFFFFLISLPTPTISTDTAPAAAVAVAAVVSTFHMEVGKNMHNRNSLTHIHIIVIIYALFMAIMITYECMS